MLIRDYAQPLRCGYDMDAPCPVFGWPNTVVDARAAHTSYPEHQGALSIKAVFSGRQFYEVGRARYAVTPERYLLLNQGQRHAHNVDEEAEVFILMFRRGLAAEVLSSLIKPSDRLLEGHDLRAAPGEFFERTYPRDSRLHTLLRHLRDEVRNGLDEDGLEHRRGGSSRPKHCLPTANAASPMSVWTSASTVSARSVGSSNVMSGCRQARSTPRARNDRFEGPQK